jgi:hypothetical protein
MSCWGETSVIPVVLASAFRNILIWESSKLKKHFYFMLKETSYLIDIHIWFVVMWKLKLCSVPQQKVPTLIGLVFCCGLVSLNCFVQVFWNILSEPISNSVWFYGSSHFTFSLIVSNYGCFCLSFPFPLYIRSLIIQVLIFFYHIHV